MARELASLICSEPLIDQSWESTSLTTGAVLNALLSDTDRREMMRRAARLAVVSVAVALPEEACLARAEPFPCRLTTQELVDLLKMPTCFGKARRAVLDHLGNRYGRRFDNHWAFVRYAREQGLNLDLTTPPKRPDPRESVERMLAILDRLESGR
jgi:hypothetical protein